jgi:hypothetical protein
LTEKHGLRAFENRVLRKIFGPRWDEVTWEWRRLHNKELHDLYSSPLIIRAIKSRIMRYAGHAQVRGRGEVNAGFWRGNLKEINHLEDRGVDRRIALIKHLNYS